MSAPAISLDEQDGVRHTVLDPREQRDAQELRMSRSPHPYHRTHQNSRRKADALRNLGDGESLATGVVDEHAHDGNESDASARRQSGSDSGVEADNEGLHLLKSLPPPPLLRRKGLRGAPEGDAGATPSPPFTPFPLELSTNAFEQSPDERTIPKPARIELTVEDRRKRFAEFLRRAVELALIVATGGILVLQDSAFLSISNWQRELFAAFAVLIPLAGLYPVRLYIDYLKSVKRYTLPKNWKWFRIRSTFDPAPLVYPVLLPILVSICLGMEQTRFVLPNILLALATLPPELVPFSERTDIYNSLHWVISLVPLLVSDRLRSPSVQAFSLYNIDNIGPDLSISIEKFSLLFPLHFTLVDFLRHLTKTSLLAAELQLLSVALINVLMHAQSPQTVILKCLLWGVGSGIAVFCCAPLEWGLVLARIPRWRFRRPTRVNKPRNGIMSVLSGAIHWGQKESLGLLGQESETSSNDEEQPLLAHKRQFKPSNAGLGRKVARALTQSNFEHLSTDERLFSKSGPSGNIDLQRRHTISSPLSTWESSKRIAQDRLQRWRAPGMKTYLSLTLEEAVTRKWVYAGYVYACTVLLILGPARMYIGKKALSGHEPVGWALGYMFGNVQPLRLWAVKLGLERWICLPERGEARIGRSLRVLLPLVLQHGFQHFRTFIIGTAETRLWICVYFLTVLACGMLIVLRLGTFMEVDTRRKVFHGMMVAMLVPSIPVDPAFMSLALGLILAIFLLLELFRATQLPPISKPLARFLTPYVDGRDLRGPVVVSHIFLLIGCAIPLWFSVAAAFLSGADCEFGWELQSREVAMVSGVICVGMGDAAASLIGRRYGRTKWPWGGGKSLNGSAAFAVAVAVGLTAAKAWLWVGGWQSELDLYRTFFKAALAGTGGSLIEATLTGCNDNVVVPVFLWLLTRGLDI